MGAFIEQATFITGIAMSFAAYFQLYKIFRTWKSDDVAYGGYIVIFFGCIMWVIYGVYFHDWVVTWTFAIGIPANGGVVIGKYYFEKIFPKNIKRKGGS